LLYHQHSRGHSHQDHDPESAGPLRRLLLRTPHAHEITGTVDEAMETSRAGMRALWLSLAVLAGTAAAQALVVALSGSIALLGDSLHNAADALTAVPLGVAFTVGRRAANGRYTYGYGRAEDLAGVVIVMVIIASAAVACYEAAGRLIHPHPVTHLAVVAAAAVIGFTGNELVARYRIRIGRRIGSAALVADGLHARTDGFASLAVLPAAVGVALGWPLADPVIGVLITLVILITARDAARDVCRRLMDAVDPGLDEAARAALRATPGVRGTGQVRLRWTGHRLRAECEIVVDSALTVVDAHEIAVAAEHALRRAVSRLTAVIIHVDYLPPAAGHPLPAAHPAS
jgi:cation diffusion facilitator family transporter